MKSENKYIIISIIFLSLIISNNSYSIEPDVFVQSTVNRASKLLSEDISKSEKVEKLKLIAKDTVDIKGIGLYTLGSARKNLSNEEKSIYKKRIEAYFIKIFSSTLA